MSKIIGAETITKVETQPQGKIIAYWSVTLLLAAAVMLSGIGQLMQYGGNIELVKNLGYPLYVLTILGTWKVLGAIALVVPGFPRLKEWVHAGIFFLMTGAAVSHAFAGDYGFPIILPLSYAALNIASWALRPKSRML
ncbi:putative membrane protein YphA (DoxX/SURF4 family) [Paenibacillus sp. V4I3]|uniref:DoxX family protein n=1 Tax=unclassified Paenibacillus TaxID=185978 RepID=UPI0027820983|nr:MULTISPECIES: DoxX family protein [unclassified Paenibacillus]MDQ0878764.1 putative membrane protein YphA (DoxX/SURF4 family) [Paenibacillus sp. V4I3]MDQ0885384.1 putative membrane protein YphA (DoxX/SURF4 family) [Paenibacillus sp. V4I9]